MELHIYGTVQSVLAGVADQSIQSIPLAHVAYALGAGCVTRKDIGEAIVFDGMAHVHTNEDIVSYETALQTPFLMGFSSKPDVESLEVEHASIDQVYRRLFAKYPEGFVICGDVLFEALHTSYVKKSPVHRENINEHKGEYWATYDAQEVEAALVGVVVSTPYPEGFYVNPNETSDLLSHTHVLLGETSYHLLNHSIVKKGSFDIAPIDGVICHTSQADQ